MIVDGRPVSARRLKDLVGDTGEVWLGTITLDDHGRGVQDVEVRGIRPGASREVLARATAASLKRRTATEHSHAPESRGEARQGVNHYPAQDEAIFPHSTTILSKGETRRINTKFCPPAPAGISVTGG
jgi:hypothetical protein